MTSQWWQYSRGEDNERSSKNFFIFYTTPLETSNKQFNLRYNCSADTYERLQPNATGQLEIVHSYSKWQTCVYCWENIARKEEYDHGMVYLAKADVSNANKVTGLIEWWFDFSNQGLKIKEVTLNFGTMLYRDGKVEITILNQGRELPSIDSLKNLDEFALRVKLTGRKGTVVYQNAQIFRQSMRDIDRYPFELLISFY